MPARLPRSVRFARIPLLVLALAVGSAASASLPPCSNATLKGTYLYSESGMLNGKPYAESGSEVYDGRDCSRFVYTITAAPGGQLTVLSGAEVRVAP